jgi:hypothetical protein
LFLKICENPYLLRHLRSISFINKYLISYFIFSERVKQGEGEKMMGRNSHDAGSIVPRAWKAEAKIEGGSALVKIKKKQGQKCPYFFLYFSGT